MSLPPSLRRRPGALHMPFLLPHGFKNVSLVMKHVLAEGAIGGEGVRVDPTEGYPFSRISKQHIVFFSGDTRALPLANCQRQSPAVIGACNKCWAIGVHLTTLAEASVGTKRRALEEGSRDILETTRTNATLYLNMFSRLPPATQQRYRKELIESFQRAPDDVQKVIKQ